MSVRTVHASKEPSFECYPKLACPIGSGPQVGWLAPSLIEPVSLDQAALAEALRAIGLTVSLDDATLTWFERRAAKFWSRLRQDEFGPTKADSNAALRELHRLLGRLRKRFEQQSQTERSLLSQHLSSIREDVGNRTPSGDLVALYEAACDASHFVKVKATKAQAKPYDLLAGAAKRAFIYLEALDTTARLDLDLFEIRPKGDDPGISVQEDDLGILFHRLAMFHDHVERTTAVRSRDRGPELPLSLLFLVNELADFYEQQTGKPLTNNPYKEDEYTSEPQSAAGRFMVSAVRTMVPPPDWFPDRLVRNSPNRTRIFVDQKGLKRAIHHALRHVVSYRLDQKQPETMQKK